MEQYFNATFAVIMESILLIAALIILFASKPLFDGIFRKRKGEELIGNPWLEIHAAKGYKEARKVAAFYPLSKEPNIMPILKQLCEEGRLLLPRCTSETSMEFCCISNLKSDLKCGKFGIMEPKASIGAYTGEITIFLVPGTMFNLTGERKGHGKGYYDRFLANFTDAYKVGIATPAQISAEPIAQKSTDIKMDRIIICRAKP